MKIWLNTYHGSHREINALRSAGYVVPDGHMHVARPVEGDPWEIAKEIHKFGNVKVAVGDIFFEKGDDKTEVIAIMVSDDWFHQR